MSVGIPRYLLDIIMLCHNQKRPILRTTSALTAAAYLVAGRQRGGGFGYQNLRMISNTSFR